MTVLVQTLREYVSVPQIDFEEITRISKEASLTFLKHSIRYALLFAGRIALTAIGTLLTILWIVGYILTHIH